jgi:hypothetical protein
MERWFCRYAMTFMSVILFIPSISLCKDSLKFQVGCFFAWRVACPVVCSLFLLIVFCKTLVVHCSFQTVLSV